MTTDTATVGSHAAEDSTVDRPKARGFARALVGEPVLVTLFAAAMAVLMTWPTMRDPLHTIPQDTGDPLMVSWLLTWPGHILTTDPANFWNANSFYPDSDTYAFSDTFFGYAPLSFVGEGHEAAILRYNLIFVFTRFLALVGAYALARQLGARWQGALVAGAAFAFSPWYLSQAGHLAIISVGGMALSIAVLLKGHGYSFIHGYRRERVRPLWALVGWLIAAWQLSIGFAVGLHFAYALAIVCLCGLVGWVVARAPRPPRWLLPANVVGGLVFLATAYFFARPMLRILENHPYAERTPQEISWYSPPLRGFLISPPESWLWGELQNGARASMLVPGDFRGLNEMNILPGFFVIGLAVLGLFFSAWKVRHRVALAGGVAVTVVLGMGMEFADGEVFMLAHDYLPGWNGIRTPGRIVIWTLLLLAVLAAGFVSRVAATFADSARRHRERTGRIPIWHRLVAAMVLVPAALVTLEGTNTTPHPEVPKRPDAIATARGPMMVLPSHPYLDNAVLYWTVGTYQPTVNGSSSLAPATQGQLRAAADNFPDATSVDVLRHYGIRTVVVLREHVVGTANEKALTAPVDGLPLKRSETADAVVFVLDPR